MTLDPIIARILSPLKDLFRPISNDEYLKSARSEAEVICLQRTASSKSLRLNTLEELMLERLMKHYPGLSFNDLFSHMLTMHYAAIKGEVPSPMCLQLRSTPPSSDALTQTEDTNVTRLSESVKQSTKVSDAA